MHSPQLTNKEKALKAVAVSDAQSVVQVNIRVQKSFYRQLRLKAFELGMTMTDVILIATKKYINVDL